MVYYLSNNKIILNSSNRLETGLEKCSPEHEKEDH